MLITTVTLLSFRVPDECRQARKFEMNNDMRDWQKEETSQFIMFRRQVTQTTTYTEEQT